MIRHADATERDRSARRERSVSDGRGQESRPRSPATTLQRSLGNRGVQAAVERVAADDDQLHLRAADRSNDGTGKRAAAASGRRVSQPTDPAERDARRIAERVRRSETAAGQATHSGETPASHLDPGGLQLSPQASATESAASSGPGAASRDLDAARGRPLPGSLRADFEPRFGTDFGDVRLHTGDRAGRLARQLNAAAFTHGSDVYVRPDRYRPDTADGRALLAHELTHVVQARSGAADAAIHRAAASPSAGQSTQSPPPRRETEYRVRCDEDVYRVRIVGHASPRWRHPQPETPAERNLALSWERARSVENAIRNLFLQRLGTGGGARFGFQCVADEHASSLEATAAGSAQTLQEAGGDTSANDPELRRVDVLIETEQTVQTTTEQERTRELPTRTNQWAIKVIAVEAAGAGPAGSTGIAELKNRRTGQKAEGSWIAGGFGGGYELPIPTVAPDAEWAPFETSKPLTFEDFSGTMARLIHVDAGIGPAGYSVAYFSFPSYMSEGVSVSGFIMNQWGVGGSATLGAWGFIDVIPEPPTETETVEVTSPHTVGTSYGHQVFFPTESAQIPGDELTRLMQFVNSLP